MGKISRKRRKILTYFSLKVLEYPDAAIKMGPDDRIEPGGLVQDLDSFARMCGASAAARWAESRNLEVHYVDNCWLYVTVDRNDLEDFMVKELDGQVSPESNVLPGTLYLLMAEEY
ncbi:MAG TPA: hypothetical protein VGM25_10975 [Caulobacteraceae bacterium]